ncbi:AAEL008369-PA [Aedes aegypti]|uniref:Acylphosphatase n=1 Tax=Aedes aegypti TaxID=7159 RepID=Q16Z04_AEDAE|nr:AAEL008369-PA [Aedes aegypti]
MRPRRLIEAKSPDVFIICSALLVCYVSLAVPIVATDESACNREGKAAEEMAGKLFACDFEVFGIVQGVFFRKYTQKQATSLGLKGWCMNTRDGTVKGQMEGEAKPVNEMKHWLQTKGSPTSRIDKAVFSEMKEISKYSFNDFSVKR